MVVLAEGVGVWRCHVGCDVSRACRQVSGSLQPPGLSTSSLSTPGAGQQWETRPAPAAPASKC